MKPERLLFLLIISLLVLVPLGYSANTLDNGLLPKFILQSIALLLFLFLLSKQLQQEWKRVYWVDILLLSYYAFNLISIVTAINRPEALYESQKVFLFLCTFWLVRSLLLQKGEQIIDYITKAAVFATLAVIIFSFSEWMEALRSREPFSSTVYLVSGMHGHKNLMASWTMLLIPFSILGILRTSNWPKFFFWAALLSQVFIVMLLQTRAVYVATILAAVMSLSIAWLGKWMAARSTQGMKWLKLMPWLLISGVVLYFLLVFLFPLPPKINVLHYLQTQSANERLTMWSKTLNMIQKHWLFGVGNGNWKIYFPSEGLDGLYRAQVNFTIFARPHNDYLWIWSESGIFGLLSYLGFMLLMLRNGVASIIHQAKTNTPWQQIAVVGGILSFMVFAFFDFPKERIEHQIVLAILLAILFYQSKEQQGFQELKKPRALKPLLLFTSAVLGFQLYMGYQRFQSEVKIREMIKLKDLGQYEPMRRLAEGANNAFIISDNNGLPLAWYEGIADFRLNRMESAFANFSRGVELHPYDYNVLNNLGTMYSMRQNFEQASKYYLEALRINPRFNDAKFNMAAACINTQQWQNAQYWVNQIDINSARKQEFQQLINDNQ